MLRYSNPRRIISANGWRTLSADRVLPLCFWTFMDDLQTRKKEGAPEPRPLPEPRPRGSKEQHLADAPFRERGPSTASLLQGPCGPGWSFSGKQFLTLARLLGLSPQP